jgi:hypothetical protein
MNYQFVHVIEGQLVSVEVSSDGVYGWAKANGYEFLKANSNKAHRPELQGQPIFSGLAGPMWNGNNVIRYESPEAYEICSN